MKGVSTALFWALLAMVITIAFLFGKKNNADVLEVNQKSVATIQAYQSKIEENFKQERQILNQNFLGVSPEKKTVIDAYFFHETIQYPEKYSPHYKVQNMADTFLVLQKDTQLPDFKRRTYKSIFNKDSLLTNYVFSSAVDFYEATYVYNQNNKVSIIHEKVNTLEYYYNQQNTIDSILVLDKNNTCIEKIRVVYSYQ